MREVCYEAAPLYPKQDAAINAPERIAIVEASTKSGKAQPLTATVWTPTGPRPMGTIQPGDEVLVPGGSTRVEAVYSQGEQALARVTFSDGASTQCTLDHLWEIWFSGHRARPKVVTTRWLLAQPRHLFRRWGIVTTGAQFGGAPGPIAPYLLGALLGDGGMTGPVLRFTSADPETADRVRAALPPDHALRVIAVRAGCVEYAIGPTRPHQHMAATLNTLLRDCGLWGRPAYDKHIPVIYLHASPQARLELLQGLLDTDGEVTKRGAVLFSSTSHALAEGVVFLVRSLGGLASIRWRKSWIYDGSGQRRAARPHYRVRITHENPASLMTVARKRARCHRAQKTVRRTFRSIVPAGRARVQCLKLADPRGLYLTDQFIATHNTYGCMDWLLRQAMQGKVGQQFWWVAPVFAQTMDVYNRFKHTAQEQQIPAEVLQFTDGRLEIALGNGTKIVHKSADNADSLYGADVWAAVMDEATRTKEEAWLAIRTTLTATRGPIRIIGNVRGRRNWCFLLARRAESGEPGMHYAKITAYDAIQAGVLDAAEVESAKRDMPERWFRELYLAEPSDDAGNPFGLRAIEACVGPLSPGPIAVWGVDLGKSIDWTVLIALDPEGRTVTWERFQKPWPETIQTITQIVKGTPTLVDSTGLGDPILEQLQREAGSMVEGFKFSAPSKQQLMEGLAVTIQQGGVRYPRSHITQELEAFEYVYSKLGVRYSAPEGLHDDCVCALALAVRHLYGGGRRDPIRLWGGGL